MPGAAQADIRDVTANAKSNRKGIGFSIREVTSEGGVTTTGESDVQCTYEPQFGNIGHMSSYWKRAPSATSVLGHRVCTDGTDDFVWVDACDFISLATCPDSARTIDPETLAQEVRDRLPVPGLKISSNPRRGLAGLKSWFWLEDGGQPLSDSLSRFGVTVDVEARPVSYRWEFGDGTEKVTDSPGRPYPQRSEITHTYDRSSAQFAQGYAVSVTVDFDVRWRTDGGRWRTLPGISRTSERFYPVAESQAVNSDG
ncbi:MAG: hypothetical protein LC808_23565, partial [Actinobacteria bacterium]|nr:hypothetical protein [Actinomycetota bacterium]